MTTNSDRRAKRAAGALAAAATLAMLSQPGEAAAAAAKLVSLDKIDGIQSSRVLDNGDVEIRMNDGRVVRIAAQDVVVQDGAIMVEASALADAGISLGGAGAGVSSTLLYAGVGVAAIGGGIAAGLSSGSDAVEVPPVNRAPAFTSAAAINTPENSSATGITLTASDPDNDQPDFLNAHGVVAPAKHHALFSVAWLTGHKTTLPPVLVLDGLAPERDYRLRLVWPVPWRAVTSPGVVEALDLTGNGHVARGEALMTVGMQLPLALPQTVLLFELEPA